MQNDFGPTFTNTAIYLKESGKQDIVDPANMTAKEVEGVAKFLIDLKKKGHFRTFWDGFQNGVDILASEEVLVSSCWEPVQLVAAKKAAKDIRYGTMKEGHQTWNNVWMLTKGGQDRGQSDAFYKTDESLSFALVRGPDPADFRLRSANAGCERICCGFQ